MRKKILFFRTNLSSHNRAMGPYQKIVFPRFLGIGPSLFLVWLNVILKILHMFSNQLHKTKTVQKYHKQISFKTKLRKQD